MRYILISLITLLTLSKSYGDNCTNLIKKFHTRTNYAPSYKDIINKIGKPNKKLKKRYIQYSWENFTVISDNGKIIQEYGIKPKALNHNSSKLKDYKKDINFYYSKLGAPKNIKVKYKAKLLWQCGKSNLQVVVDENNNIEHYQGSFCRKPSSPICSKFSRNSIALTYD